MAWLVGESIADDVLAIHTHDWQNDPFARGAYSYLPLGGEGAPEVLATPIADTLYFAGEATPDRAPRGTVQGAMASGHRAALQIVSGSAGWSR